MAVGSSIVNLTASGLPTETEDRAYSFCLGTQILQNPSQTPRTGSFSFKISPDQFDVAIAGNTVGATAIGLAESTNISTDSTWSAAAELKDSGSSYGIYAISVAEKDGDGGKVNVATAGQSIATVVKNRTASGTSSVDNTFDCVSHGYTAGDAVVIASGTIPNPLATGLTYFVIPSGTDKIMLAATRTAALAGVGSEIDIIGTTSPVFLESDDVFKIERNGVSGALVVTRNGATIHTYAGASTNTLRPFFWSRQSTNSATIPVFKAIKVSGAS